ncbi:MULTISPECIES: hydrogenase maturation protease [Leptolyngbya]|nr:MULTISPECIES: hydrogenase maturation protease [Leptolyngbya]ULP30070.1 hydrogenase maturation protease [Leptolyngbya boryana IU 594]
MSIEPNPMQNTMLIGVGNEFRHDDAVGLMILRKLRNQLPETISTIEASGEGTTLIELWQTSDTVYLFDAVSSGSEIATIHRIDVHTQSIPSQFFHYSSHAFGVAEAVELARSLNQLPNKLILYGVEGSNFAIGIGLSEAVEQAIETAIQQVLSELEINHA